MPTAPPRPPGQGDTFLRYNRPELYYTMNQDFTKRGTIPPPDMELAHQQKWPVETLLLWSDIRENEDPTNAARHEETYPPRSTSEPQDYYTLGNVRGTVPPPHEWIAINDQGWTKEQYQQQQMKRKMMIQRKQQASSSSAPAASPTAGPAPPLAATVHPAPPQAMPISGSSAVRPRPPPPQITPVRTAG